MDTCIFCKIISGELPSSTIYEDDDVIAFLDINPVKSGHTLIVPKEHYTTPFETPDETLATILSTAKHIAPAIVEAVEAEGFNVTFNNGASADQDVFHTHVHLIPRHKKDGLMQWSHTPYAEGEQEAVAEKIRGALTSLSG